MLGIRAAFRRNAAARAFSASAQLSSSSSSSYSSSAAAVYAERTIRDGPRNDWARDEIKSIYDSPVLDLLFHGVSCKHPFSLSSFRPLFMASVLIGRIESLPGREVKLCRVDTQCRQYPFLGFPDLSFFVDA